MANLHVYVGLENINLTDAQRLQMYNAIKALQVPGQNNPARINHERLSLNQQAGIWEAMFDENWLTINAFKQYLANVFGVPVANITHTVVTPAPSYGGGTTFVITLRYQNQNRMRAALFGGVGATWAQSNAEVVGYLNINKALWEPVG